MPEQATVVGQQYVGLPALANILSQRSLHVRESDKCELKPNGLLTLATLVSQHIIACQNTQQVLVEPQTLPEQATFVNQNIKVLPEHARGGS